MYKLYYDYAIAGVNLLGEIEVSRIFSGNDDDLEYLSRMIPEDWESDKYLEFFIVTFA